MSNELRRVLDLAPVEENTVEVVVSDKVDEDFDFARKNLYELIGKSQEVLEDMIDVARKSQHPRAYEVLNQIIKNSADISRDLLELQKQKQGLVGPQAPTTVNNNLFVGTTADLNKIIEDRKKSREDEEPSGGN